MWNIGTLLRQFAFLVPLVFLSGCQAATVAVPISLASGAAAAAKPDVPDKPKVPNPVVSFMAVSQSDQPLSNAIVTLGQPFVPGDVPGDGTLQAITFKGRKLPTQIDWKATNKDGSRRHGIITVDLPKMAPHGAVLVGLYNAPGVAEPDESLSPAMPPADIHARVVLDIHGTTYVAAFQEMAHEGVDRRWLTGRLATEWHVSGSVRTESGQPHDRIWVQFYVRRYPTADKTRVEVIVENTWTFKPNPRNVTYDARIFVDGKEVYSIRNLTHTDHARWRKVFWVGGEPKVYVRHDLNYLIATGAIPNYDPDVHIPESVVVDLYQRYLASDHGPMEISIVTNSMSNAGGRPDIGPLPNWTVLRLLTMDPRLIKVNRAISSLAGSWPVHFRDADTGLPVSLKDHPYLTIHPNLLKWPKNPLPRAEYGEWPNHLRPDVSHQPSLAFVAYLLTGDYYFLEELQFWAAWNPLRTSPKYRAFEKGMMVWTSVRGQAWSLRTLGQVAYITPDDHPMKDYWKWQLHNNLKYYNSYFANNPHANELGFVDRRIPYNNGRAISPWQDDFFTWAMGYLVNLGFHAEPILEFKARFPVGRMTAPGYCWVFGSIYYLNVRESANSPFYETFARAYRETALKPSILDEITCGSAEMASYLGEGYKAGDMVGWPWSPMGFPSNMQPALAAAVNAGVPHAKEAWCIFMNRTTKPDYSEVAVWAIVPRKQDGEFCEG